MTMKRESLDTNVILRLMLDDVPSQHRRAKKLINTKSSEYIIADTVVTEMVYALTAHYGMSRRQTAEIVRGVMSIDNINCNHKILSGAIKKYESHTALSFEDCYLAEYAAQNEAIPLWTFDKKLAKQSGMAKEVA
jgi:predicted nucleic-acid-binding protein